MALDRRFVLGGLVLARPAVEGVIDRLVHCRPVGGPCSPDPPCRRSSSPECRRWGSSPSLAGFSCWSMIVLLLGSRARLMWRSPICGISTFARVPGSAPRLRAPGNRPFRERRIGAMSEDPPTISRRRGCHGSPSHRPPGTPPEPPPPPGTGWTPPSPSDPTTVWSPAPQSRRHRPPIRPPRRRPRHRPPGQGALLSSAPVGWAPPPPPAAEVAPGLTFADTGSRVVAYIVDVILLAIVGSIVVAIVGVPTPDFADSGQITGLGSPAATLASAAGRLPVLRHLLVRRPARHDRPAGLQHPGRQRVRRQGAQPRAGDPALARPGQLDRPVRDRPEPRGDLRRSSSFSG